MTIRQTLIWTQTNIMSMIHRAHAAIETKGCWRVQSWTGWNATLIRKTDQLQMLILSLSRLLKLLLSMRTTRGDLGSLGKSTTAKAKKKVIRRSAWYGNVYSEGMRGSIKLALFRGKNIHQALSRNVHPSSNVRFLSTCQPNLKKRSLILRSVREKYQCHWIVQGYLAKPPWHDPMHCWCTWFSGPIPIGLVRGICWLSKLNLHLHRFYTLTRLRWFNMQPFSTSLTLVGAFLPSSRINRTLVNPYLT